MHTIYIGKLGSATYEISRVGLDIWGLQNKEKGPKYFSKKGYFRDKTGPQKPDVKVVFREGEKGFSKNPFSKGISGPKTGLKRALRPHPGISLK